MTSGGLTDPQQSPEGLWAKAWLRFERDRPSAEFERAYLLGRRTRDEFWYAQRFGLRWPELYSPPSAPFAAQYMTEATPSPEPCELNGVDPDEVTICVGRQQEFNAEGENLDGVIGPPRMSGIPPGEFWLVDGETEAEVDVTDEVVRNVLTGAVPLQNYNRVLWGATTYITNGSHHVEVSFGGAPWEED